ncbi:MAG: 1-acyl-sn-glycerol-3-phosphate acyltransferase [Eubacteriales bacterium]|nr:1-acyl-sn-glycerol-3-phosphate acyltransferase [Eubacteriales bacterium]
MKIKVTDKPYEEVINLPKMKALKPKKQSALARGILNLASGGEIKAVNFKYEEIGMEKLGKDEPALFLMNHSSFTDLCICARMLKDRQYHIITTNDGFVGKAGLMQFIGCIPTKKFITEIGLIKDMQYTFETLKSSILMFPEASYSFDGSETPLPLSLGKLIKKMRIPVVIIKTTGAYLRDPLYNNLQKRKADVFSTVTYRITPEMSDTLSVDEINDILASDFRYDHFRDQVKRGVKISEAFRADGLERPLYKCPCCKKEGTMLGKGITIKCNSCGFEAELTEKGTLKYLRLPAGEDLKPVAEFMYVPDWYAWERECVKEELVNGSYEMTFDCDILMLADFNSMYRVGEGTLTHNCEGFKLTGCDGKLDYAQKPKASYSLYADYFWYEIGDMVSVGNTKYQYYCFPKDQKGAIVAKARLAAEELYKLS